MHRGIPWLLEAEAAEAAAQGHRVKRSSDEELMEEVGLDDDSDEVYLSLFFSTLRFGIKFSILQHSRHRRGAGNSFSAWGGKRSGSAKARLRRFTRNAPVVPVRWGKGILAHSWESERCSV